jgi:hypothetical protein
MRPAGTGSSAQEPAHNQRAGNRGVPPANAAHSRSAGSRGAHLRADPALALADPDDRATQVTRWLCQIAADAGLMGMERLVQR